MTVTHIFKDLKLLLYFVPYESPFGITNYALCFTSAPSVWDSRISKLEGSGRFCLEQQPTVWCNVTFGYTKIGKDEKRIGSFFNGFCKLQSVCLIANSRYHHESNTKCFTYMNGKKVIDLINTLRKL